MSRRPIVAGNWKMNLTVAEGVELATELRNRAARFRGVEVVLAPPATALYPIAQRLADSDLSLAAQNCHWEPKGARTGELSPPQLRDVGCRYVIVGHSERRQLFGETDEGVSRKVRSLLDHGLLPIICCGETLEQREGDRTMDIVSAQVDAALAAITGSEAPRCVLAYEPIWAIGTGRTASPAQAQEVHAAIRRQLAARFSAEVSAQVRIQYGGSVTPENAASLLSQEDIDGALVGGASLKADSFTQIIVSREGKS